jgi:hypothetical protein
MSQQDTPTLFEIAFGPFIAAWFAPSSVVTPPVITAPANASLVNQGPVAGPITTPVARSEPPKGYYYNNKGKLKKFNPPARSVMYTSNLQPCNINYYKIKEAYLQKFRQRRKFGLRQVTITEHELGLIRSRTRSQRQEVFLKNLAPVKTRIHYTMSEIKTVRTILGHFDILHY